MVSNDVSRSSPASLRRAPADAEGAVIAPLVVLRRGHDDFLLLTEPELGEARASCSDRASRRSARSSRRSTRRTIVFGGDGGIPNRDYGEPAVEVLDERARRDGRRDEELERLRIQAGTPRLGPRDRRPGAARRGGARRAGGQLHEGLLPRPGAGRAAPLPRPRQPRAARARARRRRRSPETRVVLHGKAVGRVTSAVRTALSPSPTSRVEVPEDAELAVGARSHPATLTLPAPVAQGIERCPAEAEVASSNLAGRTRRPWPGGSRRAAPRLRRPRARGTACPVRRSAAGPQVPRGLRC